MQKLTDPQIVLLHRLNQQKIPKGQIARRLQVHRNTITAHLQGRVAYSPEMVVRLGLPPVAMPSREEAMRRLTIYQAATLLPDQPSPSKLHRLVRAGILRTERVAGSLYTRQSWVRRCASKMFQPGLYFRSESLWVYASEPDTLLRSLQGKKYESPLGGCRQVSYYKAPIVCSVADALEVRLSIPAYQVRLAVAGLEAVGVYVL